jgi:hypothetical protein
MTEILALTELLRELATLLMLLGLGFLAGKNFTTRFAWFIYSFAIWDIFYYVFLKLILNWPESWLTWDILFLIPTTWVGPVIAPVIVSISMIVLAVFLIKTNSVNTEFKINKKEWLLLISGSLVIILSFTWEYSGFILEKYAFKQILFIPTKEILSYAQTYIPQKFPWILFVIGQSIIIAAIFIIYKRSKK